MMSGLKGRYIFRMTRIENIPHIVKNGITHHDSINANKNYIQLEMEV